MQKYILNIIFLATTVLVNGQADSARFKNGNISFSLSYNSSLIYPGISAGIEFPSTGSVLLKKKPVSKQAFITAALNWYHHPMFHDNLYLTTEWLIRRSHVNGMSYQLSAGPGISRTFTGGTTYEVSDNGQISINRLAGYYYALITIGGGLGYDLSVKNKIPFAAFARLNIIGMFPYNSTLYIRPVLQLGIRYTLRQKSAQIL